MKNLQLIKFSVPFICFSLLAIAASIYIWTSSGNNKYGIDFLGGNEIVVRFTKDLKTADLRKSLLTSGFESAIVQSFEEGSKDFSVRLKEQRDDKVSSRIQKVLLELDPSAEIIKQDFVGPVIGEQIRRDGIRAIIFALAAILIYITLRFEWPYAIGAVTALVHDVTITTGIFIFSGREISASVLAALLTIIGYSLNDTIVVFDRIRENYFGSKAKANIKFADLVNTSINQTLSRTVLTSLTTLFVVSVLWLMGGGAIQDLSFALVIGVAVGTYSSVFIASPVVIFLQRFKK